MDVTATSFATDQPRRQPQLGGDKGGSKLALVLCHESDDVAALLASKGQQLRMRPELRFPAMQLHDSPA